MTRYKIEQSGQTLVISDEVIKHFRQHQQRHWASREAGGQLFAREISASNEIELVLATGPRASDKRTRTSYKPDRKVEQQEINHCHQQGLHFIGDWHTHYEYAPHPSEDDCYSISSAFQQSVHTAHSFLLIIVGRGQLPLNLYVGAHEAASFSRLEPIAESSPAV